MYIPFSREKNQIKSPKRKKEINKYIRLLKNIHRYNINVREKKEPGEKSEDIMLLLLYFLQREHKMTLKLKKNRGIIVIKACFYNLP